MLRRGWKTRRTRALSLNKGLPNYDQMSVRMLGFRRRRTETPRFSLIPSGGGPWQARLCQKTSVTPLSYAYPRDIRARFRFSRTFDDVGRGSPGSVVAAPLHQVALST